MEILGFTIIFVVGLLIVFLIQQIIISKKKLEYTYVEKKEMRCSDYMSRYDGNWLFYELDYDGMIAENENDAEYIISEREHIKTLSKVLKILFVVFLILIFCGKVMMEYF